MDTSILPDCIAQWGKTDPENFLIDPQTGRSLDSLPAGETMLDDCRLAHSLSILADRERNDSGDIETGYWHK